MQTVEVMVYGLLAVILGFMFLYFLSGFDVKDMLSRTDRVVSHEQEIEFSYDKESFAAALPFFWQDCAFGEEEKQHVVFIKGNGSLNVDDAWYSVVKHNKDKELPRGKLIFSRLALPAVTRLTCTESGLFLGQDYVIVIHYQDTSFISCHVDENDYLDCDMPEGQTGVTQLIVRAYNNTKLIDEVTIIVTVADSLSFEALEATYLSSAQPNQNYDSDTYVYSGRTASGDVRRIAVKFPELLGIDPAKVAAANLVLTQVKPTSGQMPADQELQVYLTDTPFNSSDANWNSPWSQPGGDHFATAFGSLSVSDQIVGNRVVEQIAIPITDLARSWINIPELPQSLIIEAATEGQYNMKKFYSEETLDGTYRPRIVVYYFN